MTARSSSSRVERPDDVPPPIRRRHRHRPARHAPRLAQSRPRRHRARGAERRLRHARADLARRRAGGAACLSYDVRRGQLIPEPPGGRHVIYVGTGGPGHLDPAKNDGVSFGSQGISEDPSWEAPLFALFDRIRADRDAALLGVCHTFGVMCRWLGHRRRRASRRREGRQERGHRREHPDRGSRRRIRGSAGFGASCPITSGWLRVLDSRLYDLVRASTAAGR